MAGTVGEALAGLAVARNSLDEWKCGRMDVSVATSFTDGTMITINLTDTIGHRTRVPKPENRDDSNCWWLDPAWDKNTPEFRQSVIIPYFVKVAAACGFKISGSWQPKLNCIIFRCIRGTHNNPHKNKEAADVRRPKMKLKKPNSEPKTRVRRSQRPIKLTEEEKDDPQLAGEDVSTCGMRFAAYYEDTKIRWFLPKRQAGCIVHKGHPRIEHPHIRLQPRHALDPDEIDVAETALDSHIGSSQTAALVRNRTGVLLDWNQAHYLKNKRRQELLASDQYSTSADKLAFQLSQPGISYVCLYAEYNSNLLTIKRKKRSSTASNAVMDDFDDDLGDKTDSPKSFALTMESTIRDSLTDTATGLILLFASWTTDTGRRKFDMFPEFFGADDTEGTNREERPLQTWCGKDSNNQLFPFLHNFLPSSAQWSYALVTRSAGILLTGTGLSRTLKIVTDANKEETRAIANAIDGKKRKRYVVTGGSTSAKDGLVLPAYKKRKPSPATEQSYGSKRKATEETVVANDNDPDLPSQEKQQISPVTLPLYTSPSETKIFPNAENGWCGFHKVDRNFASDPQYKSMLDAERDKSIFGRVEIEIIIKWMWYFIKHYKTMEEVDISANLFQIYLTEADQSEHIASLQAATRSKIAEFLCKSFFVHSDMLFDSCFSGMTFGEVTTSINEAWHRATKRIEGGPRPNHDLGESMKRIKDRTDQVESTKAKRAAYDATSKPAKAEDRKRFASEFTTYCNTKLHKGYESSKKNALLRVSETKFWVKRDYEKYPTTADEDLGRAVKYCQSLLDTMIEQMENSDSAREKKCIMDLKDKLLGTKKGSVPEYSSLVNAAADYLIPRFEHTHVVEIQRMPTGERVLVCGGAEDDPDHLPCRWNTHGQACDHIYTVLNRPPSANDAVVRWHKDYLHFFGRDDEMTKRYTDLRDNHKLPGVLITEEEETKLKSIVIGYGTQPSAFFERSLGKPWLRGNDTYWHRIRDRLPPSIQRCIYAPGESSVAPDPDGISGHADGPDIGTDDSPGIGLELGGQRLLHHGSDYMVPSQLTQPGDEKMSNNDSTSQRDDNNESIRHLDGDEDEHSIEAVAPQGSCARDDFMHMYVTSCNFVDSAGPEGRRIFEEGLNDLKAEQLALIERKKRVSGSKAGNAHGDFMHLFDSVCMSTDEAGEEGYAAFRAGMQRLKKRLVDKVVEQQGTENTTGVMSMPATSNKKVDKRIQKKCSPKKK